MDKEHGSVHAGETKVSNPATLRGALHHFSVTNGMIRFELYGVPMNVEASADVVKDGPARIGAFHRLIEALAASGTEAAPTICDVYTELYKPGTDIKFKMTCVRQKGHKEAHAYEFPLWPSDIPRQPAQAAASPAVTETK